MDWLGWGKKTVGWMGKYRYVLLILAVGIVLMLMPGYQKEEEQTPVQTAHSSEQKDITQQLVSILSQIEGVGEVRVMLTVSSGEETLYQTDTQITENESRVETVLVTDSNRSQTGLVKQINAPKYQGAIIVCTGGDKASVRLAVMQSVASVTGLGADQISVMKMK